MSARDLLTRVMADAGLDNVRDDDADFVIEALTAAGWRLVGPDEVDPVTVERCAEIAQDGYFGPEVYSHGQRIAAAIRALASGGKQ